MGRSPVEGGFKELLDALDMVEWESSFCGEAGKWGKFFVSNFQFPVKIFFLDYLPEENQVSKTYIIELYLNEPLVEFSHMKVCTWQ